jgi:hypothetical protein
VLTKNSMFVGKGYAENEMFKLNLIRENASIYIMDSVSLWHVRLGHVNCDSVNSMVKLDLLPSNLHDNRNKCETCLKTKLIRKPFPSVNSSSSILLELIHSDVCDLSGKIIRGDKRHFITFIDDLSKYTYLFLLKTKDEALDKFKIFKAEVENLLNCKIK